MSKYIDIKNVKFILNEVLKVNQLTKFNRYKDYDQEAFDMLIDAMKDFGDKVLFPVFRELDEHPSKYENGTIKVHPVVKKMMDYAGEMGAIGATFDHKDGGNQVPNTIHAICGHILESANNHVTGYTGLTSGAANLIVSFASQKIKDIFIPKMLAGKWAGTMCLTETQAGSSLSDIVSSAKKNDDGTFNIVGQKIFISGGDHQYCDNFIHLLLARIEGAPSGTKGISLFVVPKKWVNENQSLTDNNVRTLGEFTKMGQKGYCTAHLGFGEEGITKAYLVGEENKGLHYMFQMMNAARIDVGYSAASVATAAYHASLQYAKERPQGRRILEGGKKNLSERQTYIINHPDVRRMLLLQKVITEGSVALLAQTSYYHDLSLVEEDEQKTKYHDLMELLTPIAKTYPSEKGKEAIDNGLQILGGYGYCTDFVLQQYYRDIRIMALYEGTTGIQSLDLLGRKVVMKNGAAMKLLTIEFINAIKEASKFESLYSYAEEFKTYSKRLQNSLMHLLQFAISGKHERYIEDATIFMEMIGIVVVGWQWLKMATTAQVALEKTELKFDKKFYEEKIYAMKFYFKYELSKVKSLCDIIEHRESLTIVEQNEELFNI